MLKIDNMFLEIEKSRQIQKHHAYGLHCGEIKALMQKSLKQNGIYHELWTAITLAFEYGLIKGQRYEKNQQKHKRAAAAKH